MKLPEYFSEYTRLLAQPEMGVRLERLAKTFVDANNQRKKLLLAGNGASASISSHLAMDLSKQAGVRAVAFNDTNLITALGNDYGYEMWIAKAVELYADKDDILILISSSGKSPNVLAAAKRAKEIGLTVIAFTGFEESNPLGDLADENFWVDSRAYNIIECVHMIWLTAVCDLIIGKSEYSVGA